VQEDEIWKIIEDFPNYAISNYGKVKKIKGGVEAIKNRILNPGINIYGYLFVIFIKNKKRKLKFIHRLVLENFISSCPKSYQCNHKDGIKINNNINNLEWVTPKQNVHHRMYILGYHVEGERNPRAKLTKQKVKSIRSLCKKYKFKHRELSKIFNTPMSTIGNILNNISWRNI